MPARPGTRVSRTPPAAPPGPGARGPLLPILSLCLLAAFMAFVFPGATARVALDAPEAYGLDTRFISTPESLLAAAASRPDSARLAEIGSHWTFDLAYPLVYGLFLFSTWSWALGRLVKNAAAARRLARFALAAPLFDLAENIAITVLFAAAPPARTAARVLAFATPLKWTFAAAALAGALILPVIVAVKKFRA